MMIKDFYKQWCAKTKRNGGVLVGSSINEFFDYYLEQQKLQIKNEWYKGYSCAVANIIRTHEDQVVARDVLNQSISDINKLRDIGVDEQDLDVISKLKLK